MYKDGWCEDKASAIAAASSSGGFWCFSSAETRWKVMIDSSCYTGWRWHHHHLPTFRTAAGSGENIVSSKWIHEVVLWWWEPHDSQPACSALRYPADLWLFCLHLLWNAESAPFSSLFDDMENSSSIFTPLPLHPNCGARLAQCAESCSVFMYSSSGVGVIVMQHYLTEVKYCKKKNQM